MLKPSKSAGRQVQHDELNIMQMAMISIIVAMDEKRGIGKNNALMWKIRGELKRFKEITMGHPIIMGRKTFESLGGRILPGRTNIVITRDPNYTFEGAVIVSSLEEALKKAKKEEVMKRTQEIPDQVRNDSASKPEIFIIGGGQIFEQALPLVNRLYLTLVKGDFDADVFFPEYKDMFPKVISEQPMKTDEYEYSYITLER